MGFSAEIGAVVTVALIALLMVKEIVGAWDGERVVRWHRVLNVGIGLLLTGFAVVLSEKIVSMLS